MSTPADAWRLRQQAAQLTRLFIDAGLSGTDALDTVARLGRHLEARSELTTQADRLSGDLATRSAQGFTELTRLQRDLEVTEQTIRSVYDEITETARADVAAAATSAELLDALQTLNDA